MRLVVGRAYIINLLTFLSLAITVFDSALASESSVDPNDLSELYSNKTIPRYENVAKKFESKNYIKISGGVYLPEKVKGTQNFPEGHGSGLIGVSVGASITKKIGVDLEYGYRNKNEFDFPHITDNLTTHYEWGVKSHKLMLNGIYHFSNFHLLTPYVKAGLGFAYNIADQHREVSLNRNPVDYWAGRKTSSFAWQLGCGLSAPINDKMFFEGEYMFQNLGQFKTGSTQHNITDGELTLYSGSSKKGKIKDNVFTLGLKVLF